MDGMVRKDGQSTSTLYRSPAPCLVLALGLHLSRVGPLHLEDISGKFYV